VIRADQDERPDSTFGQVAEGGPGCRTVAEVTHRPDRAVPGERSESHHDSHVGKQVQLADQVRQATGAFPGQRPVAGWGAAHDRREVEVGQGEPVVDRQRSRPVCEPRPMQRGEQEVTRSIAREQSARAVAAVGGRSETDHHDARLRIPEPGQRAGPVFLAREAGRRVRGRLLAPFHQPWTAPAGQDLGGEAGQ